MTPDQIHFELTEVVATLPEAALTAGRSVSISTDGQSVSVTYDPPIVVLKG